MSKSENAYRVSLIIYLDQKWLIFLSFCVELCKTLSNHELEIKSSTRMKKFHCWVKYAVLNKTENEILKNSEFCYTLSNDHIQQVLQLSERCDQ